MLYLLITPLTQQPSPVAVIHQVCEKSHVFLVPEQFGTDDSVNVVCLFSDKSEATPAVSPVCLPAWVNKADSFITFIDQKKKFLNNDQNNLIIYLYKVGIVMCVNVDLS